MRLIYDFSTEGGEVSEFNAWTRELTISYKWIGWVTWVWKKPVGIQGFKKIICQIKGTQRICFQSIKKKWKMSICNRLDLETRGSQLIVSKNIPIHWWGGAHLHDGKLEALIWERLVPKIKPQSLQIWQGRLSFKNKKVPYCSFTMIDWLECRNKIRKTWWGYLKPS